MNVYPIQEAAGYDGCGLAMAAIKDGKAVKLAYLRDILDDYDGEDTAEDWLTYGTDGRCRTKAHELEAIGGVSVGMVSCGEFCEL